MSVMTEISLVVVCTLRQLLHGPYTLFTRRGMSVSRIQSNDPTLGIVIEMVDFHKSRLVAARGFPYSETVPQAAVTAAPCSAVVRLRANPEFVPL